MIRRRHCLVAPVLIALAGCAAPAASVVDEGPPVPEALYSPDQVKPGRLEYAPDRSTFAPVLTERIPYPTQPEANAAYRRLIAAAPKDRAYPASIWLFGCKPGALDEQTARVTRYRGPVVHCATDWTAQGAARGARRRASTTTGPCGTCSRSIRPAPPSRGATASARPRTSGGGSPAGLATNRRRMVRRALASKSQVQYIRCLMGALEELRGRDLVCWCAPLACHGDVLAELANRR